MDVQRVQTPRMLVWWIAGWKMSRNDEDCWDSWHSLDSPHIVNILTVLSWQYTLSPEEEVPRNSTHQWANLPVKPNYRSHRLLVSSVHSVKMRDNLRQLTRVFVPGAWLTICRLQQPSVCLMSRSLSPDGLILLVSVLQCNNGVSSTGAWSGHNDIMWARERGANSAQTPRGFNTHLVSSTGSDHIGATVWSEKWETGPVKYETIARLWWAS